MDRWRDLVTAPLKWLISRRRWRRCVQPSSNIPPFAIFGENIVTYDQIKRSFYFWYFQNQRVAEDVVPADDFAFIDRIWADWSPGYDASEDLPKVKDASAIRRTSKRPWATTGDSSTPTGSGRRNGQLSRRQPGARTSPSPRCTCTAPRTAATA